MTGLSKYERFRERVCESLRVLLCIGLVSFPLHTTPVQKFFISIAPPILTKYFKEIENT